ncbi:hypothetical protein [uncultured Megasphaera sp.]|uniref:hypothetical protein n=1 Tax=uncultured Megasphaera sp. TaxID=165188 RepID=UPI0025D4E8E0|nr:hypothetical protein [uncultured Megasphaera sp.]
MKKAKTIASVLCALFAAASLVGCGSDSGNTSQSNVTAPAHKVFTTDSKTQKTAYLVVVQDAPVTEEQLEKLGQEQIDDTKTKNVFVNFSDTDVAGIPYTYGSMQSINGKITKNFKLNKDWANKPTEDDYKIYTLYTKYIMQNPQGSYDDFVVSYSGAPSAAEAKASVDKVHAWINS